MSESVVEVKKLESYERLSVFSINNEESENSSKFEWKCCCSCQKTCCIL